MLGKKTKKAKKAIKYIQDTQKKTIPLGLFEYKNMQEKALYEEKQKIINDKGTEGAFEYLNSGKGIFEFNKNFRENITGQVMDIFQPPKDLHPMHITNMTAMYLPDEQKMMQTLSKTGADFDFGTYKENLLDNMLQVQAKQMQPLIYKFDEAAIPEMSKLIGLNKYLKSSKDINQAQMANLVGYWNDGGNPLGTDVIKQVGLEDMLKDKYKK